jgi:PBP1b-binding outer membrane lipoprotein LpoB
MLVMGILAAIAGCRQDYRTERPPVDELDPRDKGLQSKDLIVATDQMAQELLALPELNASQKQWTIVTDNMENETTRARDYDIFIDRLRTNLSKYGRGRVTLIENKAKFRELQSKELETGRDEFAQGTGASGLPKGSNPDYALYGKMQELPNRGTSTYRMDFRLTNLNTRVEIWSGEYIVKVAR